MGTVFLAQQIGVGNRLVALKVLNRKLLDNPDFLLRFQNEAGSTGLIHHPNVVTIYESAQADDGTPYIAMEFLEGESLREALRRRGALGVPDVAEILQQVARGLGAAHRLGIIHRDLKPDNLFLARGDEGELIAKVVDFGIAKLRESSTHTQTGMVLGTPAYMSYEQACGMRSDELDARSDVYSLGIVVYEMLAGRVPFHSDTPLGYVRKHMLEDPPPFHAVAPSMAVPGEVEAVVMKALAKNRDERYATAIDFARDFARAASATGQTETSPFPPTVKSESPDRERAEQESLAREKAEAERREKERAAAELAALEKSERDRLAREKAETERREKERAAAELAAREKAERDRLAREKAEAERREKERAAAELAAREKSERDRLAREKAEAERREKERAAAELAALEKAEGQVRSGAEKRQRFDQLVNEGNGAFDAHDYGKAAVLWGEALKLNPDAPGLREAVGMAQQQLREERARAEEVAPQPEREPPTKAATRPPAAAQPLQFAKAPEQSTKLKVVAIALAALILIVAGVWYFSPSANPPVKNPQRRVGMSQTHTGQQFPPVATPAPRSQSPPESGTNAADQRQQVEAAKNQGDRYYENGQYDNAINTYQGGLKLDPSNAQLLKALQRTETAKAAEQKFNQ